MNGQFQAFKRKIILLAVVKSCAVGVAAGLVAVAAALLPYIAGAAMFPPMAYAGIGVGAALVAGGAAYLVMLPTDRRIARMLDSRLGLPEKVQTMIAYRDSADSLVAIQRDDAQNALAAAGTRRIGIKRAWAYALAFILAAGVFATSLTFTLLKPEPEITYADTTDWQIAALRELIQDVEKNTAFQEECRESILEELNGIMDAVYDEQTQTMLSLPLDELYSVVTGAMVDIDGAVQATITCEAYGLALSQATTDAELNRMGIHIAALNTNTVRAEFTNIKYKFDATVEDPLQAAHDYAAVIDEALLKVDSSLNARLHEALAAYADALAAVAVDEDGAEDANRQAALAAQQATDDATVEVSAMVNTDSLSRSAGKTVIYRLQEIFEIPDGVMPALHVPVDDVPASGSTEDGGKDEQGGGATRPPSAYGSEIYWPGHGYVKYSEALDGEYRNKFNENDDGLGKDYLDFINDYFNAISDRENAG